VDDIANTITPQERDQATLKANCLARDDNRCLITGLRDAKVARGVLSDAERQNVLTCETEAAHIIPFSLAAFNEHDVLLYPSL
jgi:hypothetical protein